MSDLEWYVDDIAIFFREQILKILKSSYDFVSVFFFFFQMRHLFLIIDMSEAMNDQDLKPTRLLSTLKVRVLPILLQ